MKVGASIRKMKGCKGCYLWNRNGVKGIGCKVNPRHKQRQG